MNLRKIIMMISFVFLLITLSAGENEIAKAGEVEKKQDIVVEDGMTQEAFSYDEVIKEEVYVETPVDSDKDGKKDRVYVEIIRPKETGEEGVQVPVIYNISPYNGGLPYPEYHDVDEELYDGKSAPGPALEDHYAPYFVPRGYAVVNANSIGTEGSDGCPTTGDENEILAAKSVIDWLNQRADAYDEEGNKVIAEWSTGKVGMIGKSYNGTLANGVATTGVEGLETIVPIAAISNWYDYYRSNGAVIAPGGYQGDDADRLARGVLTRDNPEVCDKFMDQMEEDQDRVTGDYSEFWDARNYLNDIKNIKASVFLVHGLNDVNVQRKQTAQMWDILKENDIPRKLWWHQGEHVDPSEVRGEVWLTTLNKWFAHWLYDIDNGIMDEPIVDIEKVDHTWEELEEWPHEDAEDKTLYLTRDHDEENVGLSLTEPSSNDNLESFVDDASLEAADLIKDPFSSSDHRLAYVSAELTEPLRLSGTPKISLQASINQPAANLSALLVDYGPEENTIVTRGWKDPANYQSLSTSEPLKEDEFYTFSWEMEPHEYEFQEGHRIGVVIISSDHEYTKRPKPGTELIIDPAKSQIVLPLAGKFPGEEDIAVDAAAMGELDKDEPSKTMFLLSIFGIIVIAGLVLLFIFRKKSGDSAGSF